jgi:hypothetical protein
MNATGFNGRLNQHGVDADCLRNVLLFLAELLAAMKTRHLEHVPDLSGVLAVARLLGGASTFSVQCTALLAIFGSNSLANHILSILTLPFLKVSLSCTNRQTNNRMGHAELVMVMYDPSQTTRSRELNKSLALSHAAKVSHSRRYPRRDRGARRTAFHESSARCSVCRSSQHCSDHFISTEWQLISHPSLTILNHGNSDPFESTAVAVTPEISSLLTTWKTHYESNVISTTRELSAMTLRYDMAVDSELRMTAVLVACESLRIVQSLNGKDRYSNALKRKINCLKQLRDVGIPQFGSELVPFILSLTHMFIAAVLLNEVSEARTYEAQLRRALTAMKGTRFWSAQSHQLLLSRIYYYDQHCALLYMRAPVLDPTIIDQYWDVCPYPVSCWLQRRSPRHCIVSGTPFSEGIGELFVKLQNHIDIVCQGIPDLADALDQDAIFGPVLYSVHLTSMAFNHLRLAEEQFSTVVDTEDKHVWKIEIMLTLAVLLFLASFANGPRIAGLRQRGYKASLALRCSIERGWDNAAHGRDPLVFRYAHVWAIYIGAIWEWSNGDYDKGQDWFNSRLAADVRRYKIASWSAFKEITGRFLSVPTQREAGAIWFLGMTLPPGEVGSRMSEVPIPETFKELLFPFETFNSP